MSGPSDSELIARCLADYDLGTVTAWRRHGGTAGRTWRVATAAGTWLLRMRGIRTSTDAIVTFDHALRRYLVERAVPTAVPVPTRHGGTFIRHDGRTFEVYPFVEGTTLEAADSAALAQITAALALFHRVAAGFPAARTLPPVSQYSTVGVPAESDRMEDPELLVEVYRRLAAEPGAVQFSSAISLCERWLQRLRTEFGRETYGGLPHTVTHGDYTLANLLFAADGRVNGIFDLDWARWAPRVRDLADGMLSIAGARRSPLRPGDIWSLAEATALQVERCVLWLRTYHQVAPLTAAEVSAVPLAAAARWLSIRVEGTAKVPAADRLRFAFGNVTVPLLWFEENWPAVVRGLALPAVPR